MRVCREREDRLGIDGHARLGARTVVLRQELVVVQDDSVVDPDDRPVADGVVVGGDRRVALGVVADVDQRLRRVARDKDSVEQLARAAALLADRDRSDLGAVRVPDGVSAALGDPGQERLGCERPIDA